MGNLALTEAAQDKPVVLYLEDDELVSKMVCEFLDLQCYQVIQFASLHDSYESLLKDTASTKPVVLILDINMQEISGYQVCEILRSGLIDSSVPIFFTSGLMEKDDILKAYKCGGDDYIAKPVKLSELKVKLNQQLKIHKEKEGVSQQSDLAKKMAFKAMAPGLELVSILNYNLLQNEENVLLDNIYFGMSEAQNIFDQSAENEIRYRNQLGDLLNRLNSTTTKQDELIG